MRQNKGPVSLKTKILLGGAVLAAAAAAACFVLLREPAVSVSAAAVEYRDLKDGYTEEGTVTLGDRIRIVSEVSGPVLEICAAENDVVHKGDLIYRVDPYNYVYQKNQAESALESSRARLSQSSFGQMMTASPVEYIASLSAEKTAAEAAFASAATGWNAAQALYQAGDISRMEMEQARAQYTAAEAALARARARYEESSRYLEELRAQGMTDEEMNTRFYESERRQLEAMIAEQEASVEHLEELIGKCELRADRDGVIVSLPVREQTAVAEGQVTAEIQGSGEPGARADVLTQIAPYLREGSEVEGKLLLRGKEEIYPLEIVQIYRYAEKGTSALGLDEYRVHVRLKLKEDPERPEETARLLELLQEREGFGIDLTFPLFEEEHVLCVPAGCVFTSEDEDHVFVIENGRASMRRVVSRYRSASLVVLDEEQSEIREGDLVIDRADGEGIADGVKVRY